MRGMLTMIKTEMRLFLREPMASFFTLMFPLMLLLLFGSIWGNTPTSFYNGMGYIDTAVPAFMAMIIATAGLVSLSIQMAEYRDNGILRRLRATPISPVAILASQVTVLFCMALAGTVILILVGKIVYGLRFQGSYPQVVAAYLLGNCSFFGFGFLIASVMPNARTAQIAVMFLFYPMLFLSGAAIPREILPQTVRTIAQILPLTHVVILLRGVWQGSSLSQFPLSIAYLSGLALICIVISNRTFRWE